MSNVNIEGLDKAEVLAALYNNSAPQGMGFLQAQPGDLKISDARSMLETGHTYFDYLLGRPLKVDLAEDTFDARAYDRDNGGSGTAAKIVEALRSGTETDLPPSSDRAALNAMTVMDNIDTPTTIDGGVVRLGLSDVAVPVTHAVDRYLASDD